MAENDGASSTVAAPAPNKTVRLYHIGGYKNTNNAPRPEVDSYHQYKNPMNQQNFLPNLFNQQQAQYQQQGPYKQTPLGYPNRDLIIYDKKTKCYYKIEDDDSDEDDSEDGDDDESEEETEEDSQEEETDSGEEDESEDGNDETLKTQRSQQQIEEKPQLMNAAVVVGKEQKGASEGSEEEEDSEQETETKGKNDKLNVSQKTVGSEGTAGSLEGSDGTSVLAVDGDQESSGQKKKVFLKNHAIKGQVKKTVVTDKKLEITDDAVTKMETPLPKAKKDRRLSEVSKKSNGSASNLDVINESVREMATESAVFVDENSRPEQSTTEADQVAKKEKADVTDG